MRKHYVLIVYLGFFFSITHSSWSSCVFASYPKEVEHTWWNLINTIFLSKDAIPDWKDRHDILACLRATNYDPHECISAYMAAQEVGEF